MLAQDKIPVLMFHSIQFDPNDPDNSARIAKETFAAQMKYLSDNHYLTLSLTELYEGMKGKNGFPPKSCVLTFDDGYDDFYTNAWPVLKEYGFHAAVFMITSFVGKPGYLTQDELKQLSASGVDIQCHTVTHPYLNTLAYDRQYTELSDSKTWLENHLGGSVDFIAYPSGKYNSDTLAIVDKLGYKLAFRMSGGWADINDNPALVPRVYVGNNMETLVNGVTKIS